MEGLPTTGQKRARNETSSLASEPPPARTRGDAPAAVAVAAAAAPVPLGSPFPGAVAQTHATIYRRGAFFSDKTKYIREIENQGEDGRLIIALFPRRFGKSTFLDTLGEYYDVRNVATFEQLFGHTEIGKNPTPLRSKFMVLRLKFMDLDASSYGAFNASFSAHLKKAIATFCDDYGFQLPVQEEDGVALFETLWRAVRSKHKTDGVGVRCILASHVLSRSLQLYLLVDEYDNSVWKAATTRADNYKNFRDGVEAERQQRRGGQLVPASAPPVAAIVPVPAPAAAAAATTVQEGAYDELEMFLLEHPGYLDKIDPPPITVPAPAAVPSNFTRFFSAIKGAHADFSALRVAVTGVLPVAMAEFAGSGGNNFFRIAQRLPFRGLYGLTADEVKEAISRVEPALPRELHVQLLGMMEHEMNGYRLEDGSLPFGKAAYFNPARVAFSLKYVQERWAALKTAGASASMTTLQDLWSFSSTGNEDSQTKPAESVLERVVNCRSAQQVISELLAAGPDGVRAPAGVTGFTVSSMQTERDDLLSFLYYTGAVTFARASTNPRCTDRPRFCIPNLDARHDYLEQAYRLLSVNKSELAAYERALPAFINDDDIAPLVAAFEAVDRQRTGQAITHGEAGFQSALFTALALARPLSDRVFYEPRASADSTVAMDLLYEVHRDDGGIKKKIFIELRNLRIEDLIVAKDFPKDWHQRARAFLNWLDTGVAIDEAKVRPLTAADPQWYRDRYNKTVGLYMAKAANSVRAKYIEKLKQNAGACSVWVLVRVGVGRVLHQCVFKSK